MAKMEVDDLEGAATYINTAMGIAQKRGQTYSNHQIIDQRARLRFRMIVKKNAPKVSKLELNEALEDLNSLFGNKQSDKIHPLRSAELLEDLLEELMDDLDQEQIEKIKAL